VNAVANGVDTILSEIEGLLGRPHADLDAASTELQNAIQSVVSFSTPLGQYDVSLAQSLAYQVLSGI
jgi:hypothetical protein